MQSYSLRLKPGEELKTSIEKFVLGKDLSAAALVTCVGGLSEVKLRMAGATPTKQDIRTKKGHFEIVSMEGTISRNGSHLHISISDINGEVTGGHLKQATVYPTAEIVIINNDNETYKRIMDPDTGFPELEVLKK